VMNQFEAVQRGDLDQLRAALTLDNVNVQNGFDGWTTLHCAAANGHVECSKYCIEMGAKVNAQSKNGYTPLHCASSHGFVDVVRLVLDAGAIVDATDREGWTPLYCAIRYNHIVVARLIIDRGGKVSNVKLDDRSPAIPDWITSFVASRSKCRTVAVAIIGIHRFQHTTITGNNDINVLKLIGKHIWSSQMDDGWSQSL
jgi:hypothetical protein